MKPFRGTVTTLRLAVLSALVVIDLVLPLTVAAAPRPLRTISAHNARVDKLAFSPDGHVLASGGWDSAIKLWDVPSGKLRYTLTVPEKRVTGITFSPDGKTLAGAYIEETPEEVGQIQLWEVNTWRVQHVFQAHSSIWGLAISPDGKSLATTGGNLTEVWDIATGDLRLRLQGQRGDDFYGIAFSPDGVMFATASEDFTDSSNIKLWAAATGKLLGTLRDRGHCVGISLVFTHDGKTLVSGGCHDAKVWNLRQGQLLKTIKGMGSDVVGLAVSPDDKILVTGTSQGNSGPQEAGELKLWDMSSGKLLWNLDGHTRCVVAVAFSPNGTILASGGDDRTIQLWDVAGFK